MQSLRDIDGILAEIADRISNFPDMDPYRQMLSGAAFRNALIEIRDLIAAGECPNHDCAENRSEMARHHRDFEQIREIMGDDPVLPNPSVRRIRQIVG